MATITKPPILDSTGQNIAKKLEEIVKDDTLQDINKTLRQIAINTGGVDKLQTWDEYQQMVGKGEVSNYVKTGDVCVVERLSSLTSTTTNSNLTITVDEDVFTSHEGILTEDVEFVYDGLEWRYNDLAVNLSTYGITVSGTPAKDDIIAIHEAADDLEFEVMTTDDYYTPANGTKHSLPLCTSKIFAQMQFDAPEALIKVTTALKAGTTYYITSEHGDYNNDTIEDGSFGFTPTKDVPVGGYVRHSTMGSWRNSYAKSYVLSGKFITYDANYNQIEQLATLETTDGTFLGQVTCRDPQYRTNDNCWYTQRNIHGCNIWSLSNLRQILNSDEKVVTFVPQHEFDFPWSGNKTGFLHGFELKDYIGKVKHRIALPITNGYGYEDVEDYVWLLSNTELNNGANNGIYETSFGSDGVLKATPPTLFAKYTANDRIRYFKGSAVYWWTGSPGVSFASGARIVTPTGVFSHVSARDYYGVSLACAIISNQDRKATEVAE